MFKDWFDLFEFFRNLLSYQIDYFIIFKIPDDI